MTREDIERMLWCAKNESQGAGPNTLAEVCEWALTKDQYCTDADRYESKLCEQLNKYKAEVEYWKSEHSKRRGEVLAAQMLEEAAQERAHKLAERVKYLEDLTD